MARQVDVKDFWPEWEIEKLIGSGSYGNVYRARKDVNGVSVYSAIKVISIPSNDSEVESMAAEGLSVGDSITYYKQLTEDIIKEVSFMESCKGDANIVTIEDYKVIEQDDKPHYDIYIRMELLTPLNTYLCDKTLTNKEIIKLGTDICNALSVCERKHIIHRDIKPENIFVNEFGDYKLGDFGIARSLESMTFGFSQKGTFNYMAPEVFNSSFYDSRADLYSLGIVLYKLLNHNRLPFLDTEKQLLSPSERRIAVERRLKGDKIPPIKGISPALSEIIVKACCYKPEDRYSTAEAMKRDLGAVELEPEVTATEGIQESTGQICNKRDIHIIFLLLAVMMFLLITIVGLGIYAFNDDYLSGRVTSTDDSVTVAAETEELLEQKYLEAINMFNNGNYGNASSKFYALKDYKNSRIYYRQAADYDKALRYELSRDYDKASELIRKCTLVPGSEDRADDFELLAKIYDSSRKGNFSDVITLFENMKAFSQLERRYYSNLCALESAIILTKDMHYSEAASDLAWAVNDRQWRSEKLGNCYVDKWDSEGPTEIGGRSFNSHSYEMYRNLGAGRCGMLYDFKADDFIDTTAYYELVVTERKENGHRIDYTLFMEPDGTLLDAYMSEN
ncbi:MAG: serine/threonine protein kinase [Lachnospiraceae bacterium]|nr:serine/threonine protein kinase [Lachnospiraceae bacterium]